MSAMPGYDAARSTAVVVDRSGEGRLRLTGPDRVTWLQGLVTNDVAALQPGQGCYAVYLTPQGRMISDLRILATREALLLDVPTVARATVAARFEQFIITEDVVVEDVTARVARLGVHGPAAAAIVARALDVPAAVLAALVEHAHVDVEFQDAPVIVAGACDLGVPGYDVYCAGDRVTDVAARLFGAGARDITADAWDTLRIAAATARAQLLGAAALKHRLPVAELSVKDGAIQHASGDLGHYGDVAAQAALTPPGQVVLKERQRWTQIGKPLPRLDLAAKVDGSWRIYGIHVGSNDDETANEACRITPDVLRAIRSWL